MTTQPLWSSGNRGSFRVEVGARFHDELEVETTAPKPFTSTIVVIKRQDVAALADVLYRWLRESPPGRGGMIVTPQEAAELERALGAAYAEQCGRDECGHPMDHHGIGTIPGRSSPCGSCLCPAFR